MNIRQRLYHVREPKTNPATHSTPRSATVATPGAKSVLGSFAERLVQAAAAAQQATETVETSVKSPVAASTSNAAQEPAQAVSAPLAWPVRHLDGSGATGIGIDGSDSATRSMLDLKFAQFTDPLGQGIGDLGPEGRMFLQAVAQGHVPKTREGLETVLAWNSMGIYNKDMSPSGKPPEIHAFFTGFWASPEGQNGWRVG